MSEENNQNSETAENNENSLEDIFSEYEARYVARLQREKTEKAERKKLFKEAEIPLPTEKEPQEDDDLKQESGVLLSDKILHYCKKDPPLVVPFDPDRLGSARYNLRLGSQYYKDGQYGYLTEEFPDLVIEPFSVVVISTLEKLNTPRFLIGRWNLRIPFVYLGLLWAGAAQVDPGYRGRLFCPIYNLSDKPVILKFKNDIVSIDFVKTTKFDKNRSIKYDTNKRDTDVISPLITRELISGPGKAFKRLTDVEGKIEKFQRTVLIAMTAIISLLAVIIAVLTFSPFIPKQTNGFVFSTPLINKIIPTLTEHFISFLKIFSM